MGNTFGKCFRITTFGESHGSSVGVVIDGIPSNLAIDLSVAQAWLNRRRPGQSELTTSRQEPDTVECLSGLEQGKTLGGPITLLVRNTNINPDDYQDIQPAYRPSHADYTVHQKYGIIASSGGGRSSARETVGRVAAGAIAWQMIRHFYPDFDAVAWVKSVKDQAINPAQISELDNAVTREQIELSTVRCPIPDIAKAMSETILKAKADGDTVGGVIRCVIRNTPVGLGSPVFDKLEADLAKGMMSLPATKGFEIGSGFAGTELTGSQHNDEMTLVPIDSREESSHATRVTTKTNHSGGVLGGIANGELITINIAFKPVSTIFKNQMTIDKNGREIIFKPKSGRHDPCVLPRAVPLVEAMASLVIADHLLRHQIYRMHV